MKFLLNLIFYIVSSFSYAMPSSSFHELYRLYPKYRVVNNEESDSLIIRTSPSIKPDNVVGVEKYTSFNNIKNENSSHVYKKFDLKNNNYYFLAISSKERREDFFRVSYLGEVRWVHKRHFKQINTIEREYKKIGYIDVDKGTQFHKSLDKLNEKISLSSELKINVNRFSALIIDTKWVNNEIWFKVIIGKKDDACEIDKYFKTQRELWFKPYDENGNLLFTYNYKGGC